MAKKLTFITSDVDGLTVKPLTPSEAQWCQELADVLARAPRRLSLVTGGDNDLDVIDQVAWSERGVELADGGAGSAGLVLGTILGRCQIHGVSV
jgi:hypothetical protein